MAYKMAATEGHSRVAGLFKWNPSNICVAFYTISTDNELAPSFCINRASCFNLTPPVHQLPANLFHGSLAIQFMFRIS